MPSAKVHLRVVLLREGCDFNGALKEVHPLQEVAARPDLGMDTRLYVLPRPPNPPSWLAFVRDAASGLVPEVLNQSSGAIILARVGGRLWGVTFGLGHMFLNDDAVEPQFGLKTALNIVDPKKLQELGTRVYDDVVVSTSQQVSRRGARDLFAIEDTRDIVRQVVGVPRDEDAFGRLVTGNRALALTVPVDADSLCEFLDLLAKERTSEAYKDEFGFIDFIKPVDEAAFIARLDARLVEVVTGALQAEVYLAPPEPITWDDVEGFLHVGERLDGEIHPELELQDYRRRVQPADVSVASLKKHEIRMVAASSGAATRTWAVYRCLVFETELDGHLYLLSEGEWFVVEHDFAAEVTAGVASIPAIDLHLPTSRRGEQESVYNTRAADECGLALLDRKTFKFGGSPIEVGDLVSPAGHLIHVKRKTQSSTLSHLFAQGRVSAEALKVDTRRAATGRHEAR